MTNNQDKSICCNAIKQTVSIPCPDYTGGFVMCAVYHFKEVCSQCKKDFTPINNQNKLTVTIKDNGKTRTLDWGSQFKSGAVALPTGARLEHDLKCEECQHNIKEVTNENN